MRPEPLIYFFLPPVFAAGLLSALLTDFALLR
jgi:hypothetical protein